MNHSAAELCRATGLVVESVHEVNELGETPLMRAAADGAAPRALRMLVAAGAGVNQARPDGVTPVWLAAQLGHEECVRALAGLGADVGRAANDGATPAYQAAQNGHAGCFRALAELRADVRARDKAGLGPVHQAAMNGHAACVRALAGLGADVGEPGAGGLPPLALARRNRHDECAACLAELGAAPRPPTAPDGGDGRPAADRRLIISTGDVSDVDGFLALAEYARTGADVLFVMNYPAYVGVAPGDADPGYAEANPGLGYRYSAAEVLARDQGPAPPNYLEFLRRGEAGAGGGGGGGVDDNAAMKGAMTDLGFAMANGLWADCKAAGRLYFCVGGVNAVNPFSQTAIKNELRVYCGLVPPPAAPLPVRQGVVYDSDGRACEVDLLGYAAVGMDVCGSLAFWDEAWAQRLTEAAGRLRGVVVMGGVLSEAEPVTMPAIPGVLNRFSSATMNQLYHPQRAAEFLSLAGRLCAPLLVVTNNAVGDLATFADAERRTRTYDGVAAFLRSNGLDSSPFLARLAEAYYTSPLSPPRKPYDYYAARALTALLGGQREALLRRAAADPRRLYYSNVYGMTLLSARDSWPAARAEYVARIGRPPPEGADGPARSRHELFQKEVALLERWDGMASAPAAELRFRLDPESKRLDLVLEG